MSWIDRINNITLKVITGEGSVFTPLYKNASKSRNMTASVFEFNDIEGSLIRRGKTSSLRFPFEFHFTGADHIDEAKRFDEASKDQRAWTVTHPIYGDILVQPININYDDSSQNDTVVTGDIFETIKDTFPESSIDVKESVLSLVDESISNLGDSFAEITTPSASLVATLGNTISQTTDSYKLAAVTDIDLQSVQNASNAALTALTNISNDPVTFMNRTAELMRTPARFYARIQDRIRIMNDSYDDLKLAITVNVQNKLYFETATGVIVAGIAEASVLETSEIADDQAIEDNQIVDYKTRADVISVADSVKNAFNNYTTDIGNNQSEIDATPDSYTPKQESINSVKEAVNEATGQLLQIAVQTRQERKYTLSKPMGLVMLVHRLLGTVEDTVIRNFAEANNILLSEWLQIPQGREVIYYI